MGFLGNPERWQRFAKLPGDIEQSIKKLTALFEQEKISLAYLFGSLGRYEAGNDVDLAVLSRKGSVYNLRTAISLVLGTERLDLVDLLSASPGLRFEIVSKGRPVFVADEQECLKFELQTLQLYRDTIPLRRRQREYLQRMMAEWSSEGRSWKKDLKSWMKASEGFPSWKIITATLFSGGSP